MSTTHTDRLADTVKMALKHLPGSLNALAKRAGVSQMLLWAILKGTRRVTPAVAAKVAAALEEWGEECRAAAQQCDRSARAIRRAARTWGGHRGKA
jgi:transcriptional regulator with XRE-family HTH domain